MRKPVSAIALGAALLAPFLVVPSTDAETVVPVARPCSAPAELVRLDQALPRTAATIASGEPLVIVAVGSSSTAGAGASSPAHTYPAQLEAELRRRFPGSQVTVLNRGVGGEDAKQMLARFERTVLKEQPDLVIWQVGTNAILRDHQLASDAPLISEGIRRLKAAFADVILMDPQYAPKVLAKPGVLDMVAHLRKTARDERLSLFQRFSIMRHWVEVEGIAFTELLSPDGLHMNDWSYGCVAKLLGEAIGNAVRRPTVARAPRR